VIYEIESIWQNHTKTKPNRIQTTLECGPPHTAYNLWSWSSSKYSNLPVCELNSFVRLYRLGLAYVHHTSLLHSMDPQVSQMTIECGISKKNSIHINRLSPVETDRKPTWLNFGRSIRESDTRGLLCKLTQIIPTCLKLFKDSVPTAKKTRHFFIIKISWLLLFCEIIAVYWENHKKSIFTPCGHNVETDSVLNHVVHIISLDFEALNAWSLSTQNSLSYACIYNVDHQAKD
jgi:hypothetical protein